MTSGPLMTGRRAERRQLEGILDEVTMGAAAFVLVGGQPGIGKSTLMAALQAAAAARDFRVLAGRASEYELELPFGALADALSDAVGALDERQLRRMGVSRPQEVAAMIPDLGGGTPGDGAERHLLHRAARELLTGLGRGRPLLLLLEDLQWSDDATLELLAALVRRPPDGRVMIAAAHRPAERLEPIVHAVLSQGFTCLELGPLGDEEATELLAGRVPAPLLSTIVREAGGNPFYLEQLGRVPQAAGRGGAETDGALPVPPGVAAAIGHELAGLSPAARELLGGGAAAGEPFDLRLACAAAGLDEDRAAAAVDEAVRARLVIPADGPAQFAFRHPLVRRAVYERTGPGWRLGAHARLRRELERIGADVALIAHHAEQSAPAGDAEAVATLVEAAERSAARAPASAAHWFAAALRLTPRQDDERWRELLERRGAALLAAGRLEEAHAVLLEAGADSLTLAEVEQWLGHDQQALERLERAAAQLPGDAHRERARILLQRMAVHDMNLRSDEAAALAGEAVAAAEAAGDRILLLGMRALQVESLTSPDPRRAMALLGPLVAEVATTPDDELRTWPAVFHALGWAATHLERYDEGARLFERGLELVRRTGDARLAGDLSASVGDPYYRAGRAGHALAMMEEAVERARAAPSARFVWWSLFVLGMTYGRIGDADAALRTMAECQRVAAGLPPRPELDVWTPYGAGVALAAAGRLAEAAERIAPLLGEPESPRIQACDRQWARAIVLQAALAGGDLDLARRWAADGDAWAEHSGLAGARGWALRGRAEIARHEGDMAVAAQLGLDAGEAFDAGRAPLEAHRARALAAGCLAEEGDRAAAVRLLVAAEEAFTELGSEPDAGTATRDLRRLGRRLRARPRSAPASPDGPLEELSAREREIAALVADGLTNREIATQLFIGEKTVETHLRNTFAKLRVDRRAAVGALVRAHGV